MKIIEQERAPNPRRVKIFVAEKGLEIPFEKIEINKGEHQTPQFTALNPMQRVPVLVLDDGTALSESVAICRYFEELYPSPPLFGHSPLSKANVEMWNRRMELSLMQPVSQVFRHSHPAMAQMEIPQISEWAKANVPRVYTTLEILNNQLATRSHVAGEEYSIADITAFVAIDFMKPAKLTLANDLIHIRGWIDRMAERPSSMLR
ncbi:MAG: glutathione S-transferase family protein [Hyphomicrobiaceae bacterium]